MSDWSSDLCSSDLAALSSRSANITRAPSASRRRAMARPIPCPAPVTIATRPSWWVSRMSEDRAALAEARVGNAAPGVEHLGFRLEFARRPRALFLKLFHAEAILGGHAVGIAEIEEDAARGLVAPRPEAP